MKDKFEFYDVLGVMIPGSIVLGLVCVTFPEAVKPFSTTAFPDAFTVVCLTAVAVFLGQLIQALASLMEPIVDWTWGGRPWERALEHGLGDRYLPLDSARRIRAKLARVVGEKASPRSLFLYAMQKAETGGNSRVAKFNGLYAYHRGMLTLVVVIIGVLVGAMGWGGIRHLALAPKLELVAAGLILLLIVWFRAKQRGFYYVREVLYTTERLIDAELASAK
jgi:hypothetical protein